VAAADAPGYRDAAPGARAADDGLTTQLLSRTTDDGTHDCIVILAGVRVAVTGGAGFIGVHTVEALIDGGADIAVIDDLRHASSRPLPSGVELIEADVASVGARRALEHFGPEAIVHLAAQGGVNRSWREPVEDATANVIGTLSMLVAAVAAGCRRFVFASSGGALYGATQRLPTPEVEPAAPLSPYGTAKLAAETYLDMFTRRHGLSACALRYGNVYGPGQDGTGEAGLIAITCRRLLAGSPPVVRGDGQQTRDFVFVGDVVRANLLALDSSATEPLNIGTGVETPVAAVVAQIMAAAGVEGAPDRVEAPPGEVRRCCLDNARAREVYGWSPAVTLGDGLSRTYRAFARGASLPVR
jgi:UDP-glucose 4-epimerase